MTAFTKTIERKGARFQRLSSEILMKETALEPTYNGSYDSKFRMEPNLDELRKRLIKKIDMNFKDVFEGLKAADDVVGVTDSLDTEGGNASLEKFSGEHRGDDEDKNRDSRQLIRRKIFKPRESVLSVLLRQSKNIRTIYNIFVAIVIHIFLNTWADDWMNNRSIFQNIKIIWWNLGNIPIVLSIWCSMQICTLLIVYSLYNFWATSRRSLVTDVRIFDLSFLFIYVLYQTAFVIIPAYLCRAVYHLPPASTLIVILEQLRLLMKVHSFVRENVSRSMRYVPVPQSRERSSNSSSANNKRNEMTQQTSEDNIACPDFSRYLYFLFAPTLLYRDDYPQTDSVNWNFVRSNLVQALFCIIYSVFIFTRFVFPGFRKFGTEPMDLESYIQAVFNMVLPGTMLLLIFHFMFLHSWLNAFAEMLRFADRLFYRDWWTSTSYAEYYRNWNVVVHDFLKAYIMNDIQSLLYFVTGKRTKQTQFISLSVTFLVSAVVHEYVIVMAAGFFYPILFFMFAGFGFWFMIFVQNNRFERFQNTIFWFCMTLGMGMIICFYSQEWYAQLNCPHSGESIWDYIIPRSFACYW